MNFSVAHTVEPRVCLENGGGGGVPNWERCMYTSVMRERACGFWVECDYKGCED